MLPSQFDDMCEVFRMWEVLRRQVDLWGATALAGPNGSKPRWTG